MCQRSQLGVAMTSQLLMITALGKETCGTFPAIHLIFLCFSFLFIFDIFIFYPFRLLPRQKNIKLDTKLNIFILLRQWTGGRERERQWEREREGERNISEFENSEKKSNVIWKTFNLIYFQSTIVQILNDEYCIARAYNSHSPALFGKIHIRIDM